MKMEQLEKLKNIINKDLKEGKSLKSILKKYGVQKKDFAKIGYSYNTENKQFENVLQDDMQEVIQDELHNGIQKEVAIDVVQDIASEVQIKTNDYINNNLDVLEMIIKQFKNNNKLDISIKSKPNNNIIIELPTETDKKFQCTFRIHKEVYLQFKKFCNENKQFTQKELISQALNEFIINHS